MIVHAYAKINLTLDILGKRQDGYHDLVMVMQSVGLHDSVSVKLNDDTHINLKDILIRKSAFPAMEHLCM